MRSKTLNIHGLVSPDEPVSLDHGGNDYIEVAQLSALEGSIGKNGLLKTFKLEAVLIVASGRRIWHCFPMKKQIV